MNNSWVSCDSCLKRNYIGRRHKCLICYDYDLCSDCYEDGATSMGHSAAHPMQCILTRSDIDLYYAGEMLNSEQPQSFTCPYCTKMGFSDSTLLEHVCSEHTDTDLEVICPVCACSPGGDPNLVTDDLASHLILEHRTGPRNIISILDEPSRIRHDDVRRIPGRALGSSGLFALSPSGRESVDPIAELLSQLSTQQPQSSIAVTTMNTREVPINSETLPLAVTTIGLSALQGGNSNDIQSQFLLGKYMAPSLDESELAQLERDRADRSQYVQALMLSTLSSINLESKSESQKRGESQETNSDNVNSETNNESSDDATYNRDERNSKNESSGGYGCFGGATGQVHQHQQTSPTLEDDFVDEYTLQQQQEPHQQNYNSSVNKKKIPSAVAGKSNSSQNAAMILERRGRPPPPTSGGGAQQQQQQAQPQGQAKLAREIKSTSMSSSKEVPDSR